MDKRSFLATAAAGIFLASHGAATAGGEVFQVSAQAALGAYQTLVEDHLSGVLNALRAIARSGEAQSGDWERIKPLLAQIAADVVTEAAVWYAQPDGGYDTVDSGRSDQNLSDRTYFPDLLAGNDVLGALVVSKSTGHRSVIVATPVMVAGRMVAALGVSVRARLLSDLVTSRTGMPEDLILYALDPAGKTALHRSAELMFQFPSDMGDASLSAAVAEILARDKGAVTYSYRGRDRTAVFSASAVTGWKFVLARVAA